VIGALARRAPAALERRAVFAALDGDVLRAMGQATGAMVVAADRAVRRGLVAPGVTVEIAPGRFGMPWADRLQASVACADGVASLHRISRNVVRRRVLRIDGWAWDARELRAPAWLGAESVPPRAVERVCPGLWARLDPL
jgi:hypothetical protein